jgi:hypothetical protein
MSKDLLDQYNPEFSSRFDKDKNHLRLKLNETGHPKIFESIEQLGISSKLVYNTEGSAVNHEYITDQFRNENRPLYILEEKKVNDIIVALLEASDKDIESQKSKIAKAYKESYEQHAMEPRPILLSQPQLNLNSS